MINKILGWLKAKRNFVHPDNLPKAEQDVGLLLKQHYESCEKKQPNGLIAPYLDPAGIPTIGWGNTYWEGGRRVSMSDTPISQARADALAKYWWEDFKRRVVALMPHNAPQRHVSVMSCLAYNIGMEAFANSTVLRKYRAGDLNGAGEALEWWNKSGGAILKGLQRRRRAEHYVLDGMEVAKAILQAERDFP